MKNNNLKENKNFVTRISGLFAGKHKILPENNAYNPFIEIEEKNLESVLCGLSEKDFIDVRYFEKTEHQSHSPMRCTFGDYMINFAPDGTVWCGGIRGNGYIFKRDIKGNQQQIATISAQLSKYLATIADEKFKSQSKSC